MVDKPTKYLGIPFLEMKSKKKFFQPVINKVNAKLSVGKQVYLTKQGEAC